MRDWLTVQDEKAVKLCLSREYNRLLEQLMLRPWHISALAEQLGQTLNATHHKLKKLLAANLVVEVDPVRQNGREVRRYRAAAQNYLIPYHAMPLSTLQELAQTFSRAFDERLAQALVQATAPLVQHTAGVGLRLQHQGDHMSINVTGDGQAFDLTQLLSDESPAVMADWDILHLDPQQAKAFQRELWELHQKYQRQAGPKRYLVRLTLCPDLMDEPPL